MSSGPAGFLSQMKRSTQSFAATHPHWSVFLDPTALNFPSPLSESTTRIAQNLTHFRFNYSLLVLAILLLSLLFHPLALLAFLLLLAAWVFLYFSRDEDQPLTLGRYEVSDRVVLVFLLGLSFGVLVWASVWWNVFVGASVGAVLVVLHAFLRSTDDLVEDGFERHTGSHANLLSDDDYDPLRERL